MKAFALALFVVLGVFPFNLTAQDSAAMSASNKSNVCPRYPAGSALVEPQDLFSSGGVLRVRLTYQTRTDSSGNVLYCFMSGTGGQSPTLHVRPGDELLISLKNALPPMPMSSMPGMQVSADMKGSAGTAVSGTASPDCGAMVMTGSSTNLHFHGTNTPPTCHQDEVIKTLINAGESFEYDLHFPLDEPPGLYWYHPHIHGISEAAVQGGASGAIIVEGIQNVMPEVARLPQRVLIFRDNLVPENPDTPTDPDPVGDPDPGGVPAWDLSLNYIPVAYPKYTPVVIPMKPKQKQFWRVLNASADTILDLQVKYDGAVQPLRVIALDGVPVNSQDGTSGGSPITRKHILLAPAARAEFVVTGPDEHVKSARLNTLNVDTGPYGDNDPTRPVAVISVARSAQNPSLSVPDVDGAPDARARFAALRAATPIAHRKIYFSEVLSDPSDPDSPTNFYITVDGQTPVLFSPDNPPAIVTTQGAVEDWTVENRALENHEFHIHQIHFLVLERNHISTDGDYLDTINVPYWSGSGPYPSVTLRMDFRGNVTGDFVFHCHILGHEDGGMMATIRVLPRR